MLRTQQMVTIFLQQLSWQVFINSHLDPPQTLLYCLPLTTCHIGNRENVVTNYRVHSFTVKNPNTIHVIHIIFL